MAYNRADDPNCKTIHFPDLSDLSKKTLTAPVPAEPEPSSDYIANIHVSDWASNHDVNVTELTHALRQISKLASFMAANIIRVYSESNRGTDAGAASPVTQAVFGIAAQSENIANQLEASASRITVPGQNPTVFPGSGHPTGRA